uniref:Uncharacterized protein n=1 Tax=Anguilla anguilla TaxID=7936 RepID=A0A0E9UA61_ANGAN
MVRDSGTSGARRHDGENGTRGGGGCRWVFKMWQGRRGRCSLWVGSCRPDSF